MSVYRSATGTEQAKQPGQVGGGGMEKKARPQALTTGRYGNRKGHAAVEEDDVASIYCGVGQCRPRFMQVWLQSLDVLDYL